MKKKAFRKLAFTCLAILALSAAPAEALQLSYGYGFDGSSVAPDLIDVAPFNSNLGTLDSVSVSLQGQMIVSGNSTTPYVTPYSYTLGIEQNFLGLGGNFFEFESPAQYYFTGTASGGGEGFVFVRPFDFHFSFTEFTDLVGFVSPTFSGANAPPILINGVRSDFVAGDVPIYEIGLYHSSLSAQTSVGLQGPFFTAQSAGSMFITYEYSPAVDDPGPAPVPEPASMLLFGTGLAGLAAGVRRRRLS